MTLPPGTRVGAYEVLAFVGAGGMGQVYRVRDERLQRTVALKILSPDLAGQPERLRQFHREALALAALNHPNIAHVYGIESAALPDGTPADALIMEFVQGETLQARIARGALRWPAAAPLVAQLIDALDASHSAGIVHRDLKPGNICVTDDGAVKVIDFGLAKPTATMLADSDTQSATVGDAPIVGTVRYMSPEQARGGMADKRTDIWAFGCVVFELLTGRPAFAGATWTDTIVQIVEKEPDWSALPPATPAGVVSLLRHCLAKEPKGRLRDIGDARLALAQTDGEPANAEKASARRIHGAGWLVVSGLAALAAVAIAAAVLATRRPEGVPAAVRFTIDPPPSATFATPEGGGTGIATQVAVSPDGRFITFVASDAAGARLWLRPIATAEASPLAGTEGGAFPFWSADSRHIGFFAAGKLKRIAAAGGPPIVVADAPAGRGGTWNRDNVIVFTPTTSGVLRRVPAGGGTATDITMLDQEYGETNHRFPYFLPDGQHFVFAAVVGTCCPAARPGRLRIGSLADTATTVLIEQESSAIFASGHLLFSSQPSGALLARPFDAATGTFTGDAFPVAQDVASEGSRYISVSASDTGLLVFVPGGYAQRPSQLTWFDRAGQALATIGEPDRIAALSLSSDERRVVVAAGMDAGRDLFIVDVDSGTRTRFTFDLDLEVSALWSPDDRWVAFGSSRSGQQFLRRKLASGTADAETLVEDRTRMRPATWSPDGRHLLYVRVSGTAFNTDVWRVPVGDGGEPTPVLQGQAVESEAKLSPDGRWLAYQQTDLAGTPGGIYAQPYPATGGVFQVSAGGAYQPVWSRDGRELFYVGIDGRLMAARVDTSDGLRVVGRESLFVIPILGPGAAGDQYAATRDGRRFLVNRAQQMTRTTPLTVVLNWLATVPQ
jgi:Tol biopolymer transport system component